MKIRTQDYAKNAYPLVSGMQRAPFEAKYRTLALTFPTMIMQNGLSQAIGFLMAKDKEEHREILSHIAKLLNYPDGKALHEDILKSDITKYQLLTRRAIEAASWLKRYTQALLDKES